MRNRGWLTAGAMMAMLGISCNAAAETCITRAEVAGMMTYAMPSLITAARDTCRTHLPADAFVAGEVDVMIASYRANQGESWPAARAAFMKFGPQDNDRDARAMAKMSDKVLQPLVEEMIPTLLDEIKPESCRDIDTVLASLAPLRPDQAASLIAAILALSGTRQPSVCTE